jgi:hypothetical protein
VLLLEPEQLDVPCLSDAKHLAPEQSAELGQLLYVADTLSQFARQLGVKGCSSSELQGILQAASGGTGAAAADDGDASGQRTRDAQRWLGHTYQQLLKVSRILHNMWLPHMCAHSTASILHALCLSCMPSKQCKNDICTSVFVLHVLVQDVEHSESAALNNLVACCACRCLWRTSWRRMVQRGCSAAGARSWHVALLHGLT